MYSAGKGGRGEGLLVMNMLRGHEVYRSQEEPVSRGNILLHLAPLKSMLLILIDIDLYLWGYLSPRRQRLSELRERNY